MSSKSFSMLSYEVIKQQLLPYLANADCGALFDSYSYLRPLKQAEFYFKFNRDSSLKYATDAEFREKVHQSVRKSEQSWGMRRIDIDLEWCLDIYDVSMLEEVLRLNLTYCYGVRDVSTLGMAQMLNLSYCRMIYNADEFVRKNIHILRIRCTDAYVIDTFATAPHRAALTAKCLAYIQQCAAYTLGTFATSADTINQDLIAAEGGITTLIALLSAESLSANSSTDLMMEVVTALGCLARNNTSNQELIAADGGITALIALLTDPTVTEGAVKVKQQAAFVLGEIAHSNQFIQQLIVNAGGVAILMSLLHCAGAKTGTTRVVAELTDGDENSTQLLVEAGVIPLLIAVLNDNEAGGKNYAATALGNLAFENVVNQQLIATAGGVTALTATLAADYSVTSVDAKQAAAQALGKIATATAAADEGIEINREEIVLSLVAALRNDSDPSSAAAANEITSVLGRLAAGRDDNKQLIASNGGLQVLIAKLCGNFFQCYPPMKEWAETLIEELNEYHSNNQQAISVATATTAANNQ